MMQSELSHQKHGGAAVIAGATSILGAALARRSAGRGWMPVCNTHIQAPACRDWRRVDMEDIDGWRRLLDEVQPDIWIHAAGVCKVAECEANPEWTRKMNIESLEALLCFVPASVRFVYVSSDHVFSGLDGPYLESDTPDPVSAYGAQRVEAEQCVSGARSDAMVVRPGLPLGPSLDGLRGHWDSMPRRLKKGLPVTIIQGEARSAVWADDAADRLIQLACSSSTGIWHLPATACVDREVIARAVCDAQQIPHDFDVVSVDTLNDPHLRRVELKSMHDHPLAAPLPSILDHLALCP